MVRGLKIGKTIAGILSLLIHISINGYCQSESGLPFIRNYLPVEYGATPQIWTIVQDKRGVMYFGTDSNIIEYDGVTWRTTPTPTNVCSLSISTDNVIYVACFDDFGYLVQSQNEKSYYKSLLWLLPKDTKVGNVWSVNTLDDNAYFQTYDAIYEYHKTKKLINIYPGDNTGRFLGSFVLNNTYYVRHSTLGLMTIANNKLESAPNGTLFKDKSFYNSTVPFNQNSVLIGTRENDLIVYNPYSSAGVKSLKLKNNNAKYSFIGACSIGNNLKVFGTKTDGAFLIDTLGNKLMEFNEQSLLQDNGLFHVFQDRNNNIWLGLDVGVSKASDGQDISFWNKHNGLKAGVFGIRRFKNNLYVATSKMTYQMDVHGGIHEIENITPGQHWVLSEFHFENTHKLLVGSVTGISEIIGKKSYKIQDALHSFFIKQSKIQPKRIYSCDIPDFISLQYTKNGTWQSEGVWKGVQGRFRNIVEEENGTIWLGTYNQGVIKVVPDFNNITNPASVTYYNTSHGLPSIKNCRPYLYSGHIIIATEKGIYKYNNLADKFEPDCTLGNTFCDGSKGVLFFEQSESGDILISGGENKKSDIGYLEKTSTGKFNWIYKPFRRMPDFSEIGAVLAEDNGVFWIGTNEGLFKYDKNKDKKEYSQPFECLIRRITAGKDSILYWGGGADIKTNKAKITIPYELNRIEFEFAAPFFDKENNTLYSYQLEGYDTAWSAWTQKATKEYTNLRAIQYKFKVRAKNIYDEESTISTFTFIVYPPWYQRWWAFSLFASCLASIVWIFLVIRTNHLKRRNQQLETKIQERTAELARANSALQENQEELRQNMEELTATLENLTKTQKRLVESEKMASLGQLSAGMAHEINNPLNFISGGITAIKNLLEPIFKVSFQHPLITEEELREKADDIKVLVNSVDKGVDRVAGIIGSLQTFSSPIEVISDATVMDVNDCIRTTLSLLANKTLVEKVVIQLDLGKEIKANANYTQISHVIMNILENAIHAIEQNTGKKEISIRTQIHEEMVLVSIKDNGTGIPFEIQNKIFNPFFTTKEVGKGKGLGLSISYSIVNNNKGELSFISKPGEGTEFIIKIPKAK